MKATNDQSLDFLKLMRKEFSKVLASVEKKQEQYFNGSEENSDHNSQRNLKFVTTTLVEAVKRSLESMNKRIDSFLYYSNNNSASSNRGDTTSG